MTQVDLELPAIAGGKPAKRTPFAKEKRYGDEELQQLREALEQGSLFYAHGKKVFELESAFAAKHGSKFAVACTSGTAAIHLAMMAVGISPGDEVIVPPITDMGSIGPILWQGAVPVFADLDPHTYNMTAETIGRVISDKTRAVLAVHLAGNSCDLHAIKSVCDSRGIILIEDCAQSHGTTFDGKPVGTFGKIGCYSYNEFKHIACGDGGVCITDDEAIAKKLRLASDKGYDRSPTAAGRNPTFLAANYRMTELQGAVALAQLGKLDSIIARRRQWCGELHRRLGGLKGLSLPAITAKCDPSWWFYLMRVVTGQLGANADEFAAALKAEGLPVGAHYIQQPIQDYPIFKNHSAFEHGEHAYSKRDYSREQTPVARQILETCVILQINEAYTQDDLDQTVDAIHKVVRWFNSKVTG
jgi:dTDP-4-amino-4,6-dideoxygalactose transaminase